MRLEADCWNDDADEPYEVRSWVVVAERPLMPAPPQRDAKPQPVQEPVVVAASDNPPRGATPLRKCLDVWCPCLNASLYARSRSPSVRR